MQLENFPMWMGEIRNGELKGLPLGLGMRRRSNFLLGSLGKMK